MAKRKRKSILSPEGVQKLLEGGGEKLHDDERALLLALAGVEADSLSKEERAALEKLKTQVECYDTKDLAQAVERMVTAEPVAGKKMEWPELKDRRKHRPSAKKK
jgi:hypothetical protein